MSSIAITGGATGTGVFSLLAPSTSTNRTLTLPDSTGTVLNDQSDILTQTKAALNASNGAPIYACRAWVNFNGTGTVAIRASGNVSSITDHATGDYTVNLTTAMPDINYTTNCTCIDVNWGGVMCIYSDTNSYTTSSVRVLTFQKGVNAYFDASIACVSIFR